MSNATVTYRISPAFFAEYCYFSLFRIKNYRLARTVALVAAASAGLLVALAGAIMYQNMTVILLGGAITLVTVMIPFTQKKYIKSRYKLVYGKTLTVYTASFTKNGTFTISAGDITEKYGKQDIKNVYRIRGGFVVSTSNKATFLVPIADTLPDMDWFKQTYGSRFKNCI